LAVVVTGQEIVLSARLFSTAPSRCGQFDDILFSLQLWPFFVKLTEHCDGFCRFNFHLFYISFINIYLLLSNLSLSFSLAFLKHCLLPPFIPCAGRYAHFDRLIDEMLETMR